MLIPRPSSAYVFTVVKMCWWEDIGSVPLFARGVAYGSTVPLMPHLINRQHGTLGDIIGDNAHIIVDMSRSHKIPWIGLILTSRLAGPVTSR